MKEFLIITKDCLAIRKDEDGELLNKLLLREGDKLRVEGMYSFYENASSEYWNTIHPIIKFGSKLEFNVPPNCYRYEDKLNVSNITDFADRIVYKTFSLEYFIRTTLNEYVMLRNKILYDKK